MPTGYGVSPAKVRPAVCRTCGKKPAKGQRISFRGYCAPCAATAATEAARQMQAKSGPHYDQWRRSYLDTAKKLAES